MTTEDSSSFPSEWETCAVCEKSVEFGGGTYRINHRGTTVNLCGPYRMAAFANDPTPYIARLAKRMRDRARRGPQHLDAATQEP
ncbi:MAG: hypothetical protein AAB466_01735 [Verrucomicrobiota bacterium]